MTRFFFLALILLTVFPAFAPQAMAQEALIVNSLRIGTHPDKERMVIESSRISDYKAFTLVSPPRLVIDLPTIAWKAGDIHPPVGSLVKTIRHGALQPGITRIVLELDNQAIIKSAFFLPSENGNPNRLVVDYKRENGALKMVKPVEQHLLRMNSIVEQLQGTDKAIREDLQNLHRETSKLTGVLRNPSAQGKWGEFVLETILEKAHLIKGVHYSTQGQIEGGRRPDVIINLHDGFKIAIDSKAPINEYVARLDDDLSESEGKAVQDGMAKAVRAHIKALGAKSYQENVAGSDFVILFLPSEVVFSATLRSDPDIVDYAAQNNVVIASPTLIISLLRVVGLSWRQVEMAKNAAEISALGAELHKRLSKFMDHFAKIGKNINAALGSYNDAVGSFDRQVIPQARKFKKLHAITQDVTLPDLASYETTPRQIMSLQATDEMLDAEDDENDPKASHG